eukprot:14988386-Alexandrium_andersonii.AAC.1
MEHVHNPCAPPVNEVLRDTLQRAQGQREANHQLAQARGWRRVGHDAAHDVGGVCWQLLLQLLAGA